QNYILLYYTDNNPSTIGQTSITPDTSAAGTTTYYVAEAIDEDCVSPNRIPIVVTVYEQITISLESITPTSCNGNNTGAIDISVSGGSGSYTYSWNDTANSTSQDISGLPAGSYTVIVDDANSNCTATATYEIVVDDNTAPIITAPSGITVEGCVSTDVIIGGLTSLAYSETEIIITEAEFLAEGGTYTEDNVASITYQDNASGTCPITVTRTFTITDDCGLSASNTQTITIQDTTNPVFDVAPTDITVECIDEIPAMTNLGWTDNCDGSGSVTGTDSTLSGDACGGTITRTWSYTDACDNTATATQIITIQDTIAPVFDAAPTDITVECIDEIPAMTNLGWTDNCDGSGSVTGTDSTLSGDACGGTITRTWSYTDACDNTATATQIITIQDTLAPFISIEASNLDIECDGTGNNGNIEAWLANNGGA